ncbi:hypothetical protein TNCV_3118361 [Trichonephila clavipes]|uniref:Uncharacterized protein n=1 Tax=Trichonephila clavipes TaxID=2585209 RepID=A0A8X7BGD6_TRICX|nr:hypothetical protein TNCV_3118361 [Trichonephila clavipes]
MERPLSTFGVLAKGSLTAVHSGSQTLALFFGRSSLCNFTSKAELERTPPRVTSMRYGANHIGGSGWASLAATVCLVITYEWTGMPGHRVCVPLYLSNQEGHVKVVPGT